MRRNATILSVILFIALIASQAFAIDASSKRLIEHAKFYDGKTVTYKGEAVTAVMRRGDYGWVNINDGDNAIGVWGKVSELDKIKFLGGYNSKGDTLEIVGIFNRACQEHGGDLDIHADTMTVISSGYATHEIIDRKKVRLAFALFLTTILVVSVFRRRI